MAGPASATGLVCHVSSRKAKVIVNSDALVFSAVTFMVARQLARDIAWEPVAAYIAMIVMNGMFWPLLRTLTAEGQKFLTQIQGYKAFLEETERDRLTAPGKTAGFQSGLASLPSSIALDLKEPWGDAMANTFTAVMYWGRPFAVRYGNCHIHRRPGQLAFQT